MQQAREFISRVLPWPPAGQPGAYMNVHHSWEKPGVPKLLWGGRAVQNVADAVNAVAYQLGRPETRGIYLCMSSQRIAIPKQVANGYTMWVAQRSSVGAVELKSFFVDIDVKPEAYPTQAEAMTAFGDFLQATGLPPPTVAIDTGSGGFHVHWICERPMKPDEWKVYAFALNNAIMQHGLIADQQCTIDAARILRIPDTYNMKTGAPRTIKFLTQMLPADYDNQIIFDKLAPYIGVTQNVTPTAAPSSFALPAAFHGVKPAVSNVSAINAMAAGVTREARPVILQDVVPECGFIEKAFMDGGKDYDNTLWNLTTLIGTFAEDGRNLSHDMAKGHPTYTAAETDALYTRKMAERVNNNIGWPQCRTIAASGSKPCQICPHLNAGKSPLHFARAANQPAAPVSDLPANYTRDTNNFIYQMEVKEDGDSVAKLVAPYAMYNGWIQENPLTLLFETITNVGKNIQIQIPLKDLDSREKMSGWLRAQGFLVQHDNTKQLGTFMVAWSQALQKIRSSVVNTPAFGWVTDPATSKDEGFAYGGVLYTSSGERVTTNAPGGIDLQYKPKGELAPWLDAAKVITNQKRPELDLIVAAGFAGPLMRFTGQAGVMISAYSADSGVGKSSAMKIGQSVWGNPVTAMSSLDDTKNSVFEKIGTLKHLPIFWDELKGEKNIAAFVEIAFGIAQGKGKSRLNQDISQREVKQWQTIITIASNDSLIDAVNIALKGTEAGVLRMFEYEVTPEAGIGQLSMVAAGDRLQNTHENYGRAGEIYAKYLGQNHEQVKVEVMKTMHALEKKMVGQISERFWFAAAAVLISGARYSNYLKLTEINEPALAKLCMKIIENMRGNVKTLDANAQSKDNVWDTLTQFLTAMSARHTLITDIIPTGAGKPAQAKIFGDTSRLEGVYVHIAVETGIIRISRTKLMTWLVEHGYGRHMFLGELIGKFGFRNLRSARLGSGTKYRTGNQFLFEALAIGTPLQSWLEDTGSDPLPQAFDQPTTTGETNETIDKAIQRSRFGSGNPANGGGLPPDETV